MKKSSIGILCMLFAVNAASEAASYQQPGRYGQYRRGYEGQRGRGQRPGYRRGPQGSGRRNQWRRMDPTVRWDRARQAYYNLLLRKVSMNQPLNKQETIDFNYLQSVLEQAANEPESEVIVVEAEAPEVVEV